MGKRFQRGIWWVKRDFRLRDNDALLAAIEHCDAVMAVFIIEPGLCRASETSLFHYNAWQQAAGHLHDSLSACDARLQIVVGDVVDMLDLIHHADGFDALFSHQETGSDITFQRDQAVKSWAKRHAIYWHEAHQNGVIRALVDRDKRQQVIRERLLNTVPRPAPARIRTWSSTVVSDRARSGAQWPAFDDISAKPADSRICLAQAQTVTEGAAHAVWQDFLHHRGVRYSGGISSPNTAFTAGSRLSAHLAWGTISLRRVFHESCQRDRELAASAHPQTRQWRKSLRAFQSRLHWHDHFMQRLESAPSMEFEALNPAYRQIDYVDNAQLLMAWHSGHTGLPMVDACMRCLAATGFLNFRMRAMVVSTACFGLAQSWRSLHYPLARVFLDYEPGIHFSQIQMQAGIMGINTLRVYSPHKQLLDQDPDAVFVKRWVPELREFDAIDIAQYETRTLGDYPAPIIDIKTNTRRIRDQIHGVRTSPAGREAAALVLEKHGSRLPGNDRSRRKPAGTAPTKRGKRTNPGSNAGQMTLDLGDPTLDDP